MTQKQPDQAAQRPHRDSDPSDMTDFEKNTTTEELKQDAPAPMPHSHPTPGSAEGERDADQQSK
jgi:hypothetical protein